MLFKFNNFKKNDYHNYENNNYKNKSTLHGCCAITGCRV
jgi:hypothetical protein